MLLNDSGSNQRTCNGAYTTAPYILTYDWSGTALSTWNNGSANNTLTSNSFNPEFDLFKIGINRNGSRIWPNDIAEEIFYWDSVNNAQRILVENYLQAKYNNSTSDNLTITNDWYDGDTTANGNFDLDVAGIAQNGTDQHTESHSAGIIIQDNNFLNDNGDSLLFGHLVTSNGFGNPADLPTTGDWATATSSQLWLRSWYFDTRDGAGTTGGTVNIIFDFSEGSVDNGGAAPSGSVNNYRLLKRPNPTGQYSDIATASSISGDQVIFTGVDVSLLGSNFTLGTLDQTDSPTAVTLQSGSISIFNPLATAIIFMFLLSLSIAGIMLYRRKSS